MTLVAGLDDDVARLLVYVLGGNCLTAKRVTLQVRDCVGGRCWLEEPVGYGGCLARSVPLTSGLLAPIAKRARRRACRIRVSFTFFDLMRAARDRLRTPRASRMARSVSAALRVITRASSPPQATLRYSEKSRSAV